MRKFLIPLLATALALVACVEPTIPPLTDPTPVFVYDSSWTIVAQGERALSRDLSDAQTYEEFIAEYNAAHTDDQLFLVEGEEIPVEEAPEAEAYIVNSATHAIYWQAVVQRSDLAENRNAWRMSVEAMADPETLLLVPCTLYVDRVPPAPAP